MYAPYLMRPSRLAASFVSTEKRLKVMPLSTPSSRSSHLKLYLKAEEVRTLGRGQGTMPTHKFQIGQTAFLNPSNRHIPEGACVVTKKLPERDGEFEYRVKSANELHERVVREGELSDVP
jgi:hypothetical protein